MISPDGKTCVDIWDYQSYYGCDGFNPNNSCPFKENCNKLWWKVAVMNGIAGAIYDNIGSLAFSPDSKHLAYLAKKLNGKRVVVMDSVEGLEFGKIIAIIPVKDGILYGGLRFDKENNLYYLGIPSKNDPAQTQNVKVVKNNLEYSDLETSDILADLIVLRTGYVDLRLIIE